MKRLSPITCYLGHKRSTLLQIALVRVVPAVLNAPSLRANISYVTRLSRVPPVGEALLRNYRERGCQITVTHNPESINEVEMIITTLDGEATYKRPYWQQPFGPFS